MGAPKGMKELAVVFGRNFRPLYKSDIIPRLKEAEKYKLKMCLFFIFSDVLWKTVDFVDGIPR